MQSLFNVFLTIVACLIGLSSAQNSCAKIDFNQSTYPAFRECRGKFLPVFIVKEYAYFHDIKPYRPSSRYFLSTNIDGYSCIESTFKFNLNINSRIEAAVYLNSFANAFVEIVVYNMDQNNVPVYSWRNASSNGWFLVHGDIRSSIPNAQVTKRIDSSFFNFIQK